MRIGELAAVARVSTKAIRFYETAGVLPEPDRLPSGYREYDDRAVERLAFVRAAQAAGLTLSEIAEVIAVRDSSGAPCAHVTALLARRAAELEERIAELATLREQVLTLRDRAAGLDPAACDEGAVCSAIGVPGA